MGSAQISSVKHALQFLGVTQREVAAQTNPRKSQSEISRCATTPTPELDYEEATVIARAIAKAYAVKYSNTELYGTVEISVTTTPEGTQIVVEY
ncbi:MAG TPA: hypothetical protein VFZ48_04875 [Candidatus Saccharimonadales bacterium]